jgi:IS30 family transposase
MSAAVGVIARSMRIGMRPRTARVIIGSETNVELRELIGDLLTQRWSPQQIRRHLRHRFPDEPAMRLCQESIHRAVYQPGSVLVRPSKLAPHRRSPLRTGRHRRAPTCRQAPAAV